jgi:VanZ family protein
MKNRLFRWGPAILVMAIIFIASSTSGSAIPDFGIIDFFVKKGGHLSGYALLGAAFFHAISRENPVRRRWIVIAAVLVVLYAVSDEWHQSFTPGRTPSVRDVLIDTTGGLLGIALLHFFRKRFHPSNRKPD